MSELTFRKAFCSWAVRFQLRRWVQLKKVGILLVPETSMVREMSVVFSGMAVGCILVGLNSR